MENLGHWQNSTDSNEVAYGFIYIITNLQSGKKYIGKKQCQTIKKRKPLKGKKNKRHEITETDWRTYTSSSREVNEDIERIGKDNFKFEIIRWCSSKFEMSYHEARIQFEKEVLLKDDYYNGIINLRVGRPGKRSARVSDTI